MGIYRRIEGNELQTRTGNEQNYQLAVGCQCLNDAFFTLMEQGLTVLSIAIESAQPVIILLEPPTPEQLKHDRQRRRNDDTGRPWIEYSATVKRCKVVWRLPFLH